MSCKSYHDAVAEAALGGAQDAALRDHVAACAACRDELARLRALSAAIDRGVEEITHAEPSPAFAARVRDRVAEESAARAYWWRGWVPAFAGGAAVLVLVAWLLWSPAEVQAPKPTQELAGTSDPSKGSEPPGKTASAPEVAPNRSPRVVPSKQLATHRPRRESGSAPRPAPQPALPEVLIAGDEWSQVVKLYRLAQRGQVQAEAVAPPDVTPLEAKFQALVIAELKPIAPLGEGALPAGEPRK